MLTEKGVKGIFTCSKCKVRVQEPHSDEECQDIQNIETSSNRAYEVIETVRRHSEYITITAQSLHQLLRTAWREGYAKGKELKK